MEKNNILKIGTLTIDLDSMAKANVSREDFIKMHAHSTEKKDGKDVKIPGTGYEGDAGEAWDKIQDAIKKNKPAATAEGKK